MIIPVFHELMIHVGVRMSVDIYDLSNQNALSDDPVKRKMSWHDRWLFITSVSKFVLKDSRRSLDVDEINWSSTSRTSYPAEFELRKDVKSENCPYRVRISMTIQIKLKRKYVVKARTLPRLQRQLRKSPTWFSEEHILQQKDQNTSSVTIWKEKIQRSVWSVIIHYSVSARKMRHERSWSCDCSDVKWTVRSL